MRNLEPRIELNGHSAPAASPAPATPSPDQAAPLRLTNIVSILWRRLWLILLCTFIAGVGGLLFVRNVTPTYQSTSKLLIDRTGPVLAHRTDDPDMLFATDNFRRTQAEVIKSMPVLSKVKDNPEITASNALAGINNPASWIKQNLDTKVGDDDILYISFEAKAPDLAAKITNAIVESYLAFVAEQHHSTAAEQLKNLEKDRERQDAEFQKRLEDLTNYRVANGDIAMGEHGTANPILNQLQEYSNSLSQARLDSLEATATLEAAQQLKDNTDSLQQFIAVQRQQVAGQEESAKVRRLRDQIEVATKTLQDSQQSFSDDHPVVKYNADNLAKLEKELAAAEEDYRAAVLLALKQRVEMSQTLVTRLEGMVSDQRDKAEAINTGLAKLELLQAEFNQAKSDLEGLNSRIKDIRNGDEAGNLNVTILETAAAVPEPSWPNRGKVLRMALSFGLLLGLVAALVLEMMDDRLRTVDSASQTTGLSVLSVIPATWKSNPEALGTLIQTEPQSQFAEAFRTLRTGLFFGTLETQRRTILITSPLPGEGKSTTTANLAQALAQVGKKTILLDCDFRRPRVHEQFNIANDHGISGIITGQDTLDSAIHKDVAKNLDVLTCGSIPPNPSELLNSSAMHDLIAQLSTRYDHIVIDSPPVLAVADARILAASADVTMLVLRADQTRKKAARQAKEQLDSVGANLLGIIINSAPRSTDRYGYGANYGYGYYGYKAKTNGHAKPLETTKV